MYHCYQLGGRVGVDTLVDVVLAGYGQPGELEALANDFVVLRVLLGVVVDPGHDLADL